MAVHIGSLIKEQLEKSGMSKSEFGRRISRSSQNVYDIFERKTIDTGLLQNIGKVLKYDFFQHYVYEYTIKPRSAKKVKEENVVYNSLSALVKEVEKLRHQCEKFELKIEALEQEKDYLIEINQLLKKGQATDQNIKSKSRKKEKSATK